MINTLLCIGYWLLLIQCLSNVPLLYTDHIPIQRIGIEQRLALRCVSKLPKTKHHLFLKRCLSKFDVVRVPEGRLTSFQHREIAFVMPNVFKERIFLTNLYNDSSIFGKVHSLLHECYHLYSNDIVDIAYHFDKRYDKLSVRERSKNADSLAIKTLTDCL